MRPELVAQRRVQQVRRGVIALGVAPPIARNDGLHPAQLDFPGDLAERCDSSIDLTYLIDVDTPPFALDLAAIGDLTT